MMKKASVCEVCGKPLHAYSRSYVCDATCRKRKSRLGLDAGKNAIAARNAIRDLIKGLELDVIDTGNIHDDYYPLADLMEELRQAYNARWDREMDERARKAEK